jgi:hypothetical protein
MCVCVCVGVCVCVCVCVNKIPTLSKFWILKKLNERIVFCVIFIFSC